MALFFKNQCRFSDSQGVICNKSFKSLGELIYHIEELHIVNDPLKIEQKEQSQPMCLPLSCVLRFMTEAARLQTDRGGLVRAPSPCPTTTPTSPFPVAVTPPQNPLLVSPSSGGGGGGEVKRKLAIKHHTYSLSSSNRSGTPTGSEAMSDEEPMLTESEDSNDSWTTEEFSSEFIMKYGVKNCAVNGLANTEKPYMCPVPGCKKRYKNVNGIKYHSKNGHKKDGKVRKGYKCHCGKSYKTAQRLKHHAMLSNHSGVNVAATALDSTILSTKSATTTTVGLVAIKTKPPSIIGGGGGIGGGVNTTTPTKLVKYMSESSCVVKQPPPAPGSVQSSSTSSSPTTPKLESSFGILTPATSPKLQTTETAASTFSMMTTPPQHSGGGGTSGKKNGFVTPSTSSSTTDSSETDTEAGSKHPFDET